MKKIDQKVRNYKRQREAALGDDSERTESVCVREREGLLDLIDVRRELKKEINFFTEPPKKLSLQRPMRDCHISI